MNTKKITMGVIIAAIVGLVGWDVYVGFTPTEGDTISEVIREMAYRYPIIAVAAGILVGHWFWSKRKKQKTKKVEDKNEAGDS